MEHEYTILCVDDEENIVKSLKRVLAREGYRVLTALSGADGLEILKTENVHLVISDQRMPQMSGYEFLKTVRERHPGCVRIMLSGFSDFESLIKTVNEGEIIRFLSKPWDNNELRDTVHMVLDQELIIHKVREILRNVDGVARVARGLRTETYRENDTIVMRVSSDEKITDETEIYHLLEFLFKAFNLDQNDQVNLQAKTISKDQNTIVFDIDIGRGVRLKVIIPDPRHASSENGGSETVRPNSDTSGDAPTPA